MCGVKGVKYETQSPLLGLSHCVQCHLLGHDSLKIPLKFIGYFMYRQD